MHRGRFWDRLVPEGEFSGESLPGVPIVELAGEGRILIEGHCGIREYTMERISICVRYGMVQICGRDLEIGRMSREQLVIRGRIDAIQVKRRGNL